jgi:glycosyltransferase involved in cell wall biosynthesis
MNKVSVILPCYNGARWIDNAIKSILAQTFKNFELIIIDDGSTDNSKEIIAPFLCDKRVRYSYQSNRGFSGALNSGIKASSGDLIGFIGQDDLWVPNKLELQQKFLSEHQDIDLVFSPYYSMDSRGQILREINASVPTCLTKEELITKLFLGNFIGFETVLVKRKCFDEVGFFDERMTAFSDHDMWLRIAEKFNIGYLNEHLVKKREHKLQLSKDGLSTALKDEFLIVEKAINHYSFLKKSEQKRLSSLYYAMGIAMLEKGNAKDAKQALLKTITWEPWNFTAIVAYLMPNFYFFFLKNFKKLSTNNNGKAETGSSSPKVG